MYSEEVELALEVGPGLLVPKNRGVCHWQVLELGKGLRSYILSLMPREGPDRFLRHLELDL
jgi:hypothetical protein